MTKARTSMTRFHYSPIKILDIPHRRDGAYLHGHRPHLDDFYPLRQPQRQHHNCAIAGFVFLAFFSARMATASIFVTICGSAVDFTHRLGRCALGQGVSRMGVRLKKSLWRSAKELSRSK